MKKAIAYVIISIIALFFLYCSYMALSHPKGDDFFSTGFGFFSCYVLAATIIGIIIGIGQLLIYLFES